MAEQLVRGDRWKRLFALLEDEPDDSQRAGLLSLLVHNSQTLEAVVAAGGGERLFELIQRDPQAARRTSMLGGWRRTRQPSGNWPRQTSCCHGSSN